ncbi:CidA/LrgA family holin-like protein [Sporosarcina sp. ACRSL]|uniref:CidA/LrgA family protein n=1 Tax=Sporosarcina sp. ACRSL TaxID=2918215 RepID=UPI001EF5CEDE|nr:CidA/LrgA family holin-like protein [Sporosarcina sp. ACRSL]MCG7345856.1 CidA/LrgA family holin-like protein [Sporosarcina sp. ACRSL]
MEQHIRKTLVIILQICILYVFSYIGNVIQIFFNLIIPGSIIGLLLLFICLCIKIIPVHWIETGAGFVLSILVLFFIPTTVDIMNYPSLLSFHGALFVLAIVVSTIISIAITGMAGQFFEKKAQKRKGDKECNKLHSHSP